MEQALSKDLAQCLNTEDMKIDEPITTSCHIEGIWKLILLLIGVDCIQRLENTGGINIRAIGSSITFTPVKEREEEKFRLTPAKEYWFR